MISIVLPSSCFWFFFLVTKPKKSLTHDYELLDSLINRLPLNDRPRLRTYCHQLLAATTTLGVARVIRACLPIRRDSSNRVLPTPGDAIPSNGLPPRPPPGQYRPQLLSHHTTPRSPHRAVRPSDSSESPPTPSIIMPPSVRSTATATDRAFGGTVG